jgi:hypothetical protein
MRRVNILGVCLVLTLLVAGPARAGVIYQYVSDQPVYSGFPGQVVNVNIFLQETVTGTSTSLLASEGGLFSGGFYVVEHGNSATITGLTPNPAFTSNGGFFSPNFTATQARLTETESISALNGVGGTVNGKVTDVLLGTLAVKLGSAPSSTSFLIEPYRFAPKGPFGGSGVDGNTLSFLNNFDLDVTNNGGAPPPAFTGADAVPPGSFDVAVPEPGTLALALVAAGGVGAVRGWRRWRGRWKKRL